MKRHRAIPLVWSALATWGEATVWANHQLRRGLTDLLGPLAWGLYLILPVPFVLVGVIAWRLYRAQAPRRGARDEREER